MTVSKDLADCLKIETESNKLVGHLVIHPGYDPADLTAEILGIQLQASGIMHRWIDDAALQELAARGIADPEAIHKQLVATGNAPVNGENGLIVLDELIQKRVREIEHRQETLDSIADPTDLADQQATDFRSQSAFIFVEKDQLLATVSPPTDGFDGQDIFGGTLAAKRGSVSPVKIGNGVKVDEHNGVRATCPGVLHESPIEIRVSSTLEIPGSVDYATGNILFKGEVVVHREVQDCFVIEADGAVTVHGLVQAAKIGAGGLLKLNGGMAGREKGSMVARNGLDAKYLDAVTGDIYGSCVIHNELNSCSLTVHGSVDSPDAAIRGGRCSATMGMTIGVLGGSGGIHTEVVIGHLPEPEGLIVRIEETIKALEGAAEDAAARLDQLKRNTARLTASQAEELTELEFEASTLTGKMKTLQQKSCEMNELMVSLTRCSLRIMRQACPGSTVWFPGYRVEFADVLKGPVEILLDRDHRVQMIDVHSGAPLATEHALRIVEDETVVSRQKIAAIPLAA